MYIVTNEEMVHANKIINVLPPSLRRYMYNINLDEAEEIRLIQGKPLFIRYSDGDYYITQKGILCRDEKAGIKTAKKHLEELMELVTKSSLYSVKNEIRNGYITVEGGHRIGIAGTAVTDGDTVSFIKNISAINIRLATEIKGSSDVVIDSVLNEGVKNTLIISPPGCGKTTLLRDLIRNISCRDYCVGVADERCEIAAMYNGESGFDIGTHTSVLENCPKAYAMTTLLRSMSPDVIATDELGTDNDADSVSKIINSGVSVIATAHGRNKEQLSNRKAFRKMLPMFDVIITLSKRNGAGTVERVEKQ